jgi:hypothetical protein
MNKLFPFKCVDNIEKRNELYGEDLEKVILVVDATADKQLSGDSKGAIYMYSEIGQRWILLTEIKYNAEKITYSEILGRPDASAKEIDVAVGAVIEKLEYIYKLHEIFTKMHSHGKIDADITRAVDNSQSHFEAIEVKTIDDTDLIPIVRNGTIVNVRADVLKEYLKQ